MNILKNLFALFTIILLLFSCKNEKEPEVKTVEVDNSYTKPVSPDDADAKYAKAEFTVNGMTCEIGCAKTIEKKLANTDGVKSAKVDFERKLAMVEYNEAKVSTELLEQTVRSVSKVYEVKDIKEVKNFSEK